MENLNLNQNMKIAGNLTISNWYELCENLNCGNDDNWGLAFYFFEERIRTRYINPIKSILEIGDNLGEGFAVVNLQCSLIETIESFINGWKYDTKTNSWFTIKGEKIDSSSKKIFESFFDKRNLFNDNSNEKIDGKNFYRYVRCALLHESQTKDNWKIRCNTANDNIFYEEITQDSIVEKIIYRENFQKTLEKLIFDYKKSIVSKTIVNDFCDFSGQKLRDNFREKFNNICEESKPK